MNCPANSTIEKTQCSHKAFFNRQTSFVFVVFVQFVFRSSFCVSIIFGLLFMRCRPYIVSQNNCATNKNIYEIVFSMHCLALACKLAKIVASRISFRSNQNCSKCIDKIEEKTFKSVRSKHF